MIVASEFVQLLRKWWWISVSQIGWNGETAASLHWCCMTWQFMLSQELFFGRNGSCRERWSWQLFLSSFNLMHLSPYAFMLCGGICVCIWNKQATIISNSWYLFFPQGLHSREHQNWIIYSAIPNINSSKAFFFFFRPGKCISVANGYSIAPNAACCQQAAPCS